MSVHNLLALDVEEVPAELRPDAYFDFAAHPFAHSQLLTDASSVCAALAALPDYCRRHLDEAFAARTATNTVASLGRDVGYGLFGGTGADCRPGRVFNERSGARVAVGEGSRVYGDLYLDGGDIWIGANCTVEAGVVIKGPIVIGDHTEIRAGAYLRGNCLVGDHCTLRGELKNAVVMDRASFPHPCYVGDSLCGYMSHFGNQVTAANFGIFAGMGKAYRSNIVVRCAEGAYDIGSAKMGICMGDYCQVGCNSVTDPATFLQPRTVVYPLSRVNKGFYGPDELLKNKPMEHGVIERSSLRS